MNQSEVMTTIAAYAALEEHAAEVAMQVLQTRDIHWMPSKSDLEIEVENVNVYVRWYHRGDWDSIEFPTEFLWQDAAAIHTATVEAIRAERSEYEQRMIEEAAERNRLEREQYYELKAKFEALPSESQQDT